MVYFSRFLTESFEISFEQATNFEVLGWHNSFSRSFALNPMVAFKYMGVSDAVNFAQPEKSTTNGPAPIGAEAPLHAPIASFELSSLLTVNGGDGGAGTIFNGVDIDDGSGVSVSSAGDVNGDGFDDIIIGVSFADANGNADAGESYVVFGSGAGFSGSFDLSSLNGTNGFVINGIDADDRSSYSISSAGDVNGDGFDDIIIGAYAADPNGAASAGESYVVFGSGAGFAASLDLSDLNGTNGFVINGIDAEDRSGRSVSSAGDVNGDGFDDIIIGAPRADPNGNRSGESYIVFGSGAGFAASLDLSTLNGANGFVLNGINDVDDSGRSVSSAGDVNGDGFDDIIIGAYLASPNGVTTAGKSYVVFGSDAGFVASLELSTLDGMNGFVINGIDAVDRSGISVASAGDMNGDGFDDVIIGAFRADPNGTLSGESYIVFGSGAGFAASLELSSLNGANGFVINGIDADDFSGRSVSSAGDVNGDGFDDIIIGAYLADSNGAIEAGESYVIFGSGIGFAASLDLSSLNGMNGFIINGIDAEDRSGRSVSSAGDVNGDGFDDLLIGANGGDAAGTSNAGETYLIYGSGNLGRETTGLTALDDVYTIAGGGEVVDALAGADKIYGGANSDVLHGGDDNDVLAAGAGNDIVNGDAGNDRLFGQSGNNTLNGGVGNDQLWSGTGADAMNGDDGTDSVYYLLASAGVTFNVATGGTIGEAAGDSYTSIERFFGSNFDDTMTGDANANTLFGLSGADTINGESGDDLLYGGAGNDVINGGDGLDRLFGGNDDDTLHGDDGIDSLFGGVGDDTLFGDEGDDNLRGNAGEDILNGGVGNDALYGGTENDTLNGGSGNDNLLGQGGADTLNGDDGEDVLIGGLGEDELNGGDDNDTLYGQSGVDTLNGDAGDDNLYGHDGDDILNGGAGNDSLWGGIGADTLDGGDGIDRAMYTTASSGVVVDLQENIALGAALGDSYSNIENLYGSGFADTLTGNAGDNLIVGLSGADSLIGNAGNDRLIGGSGADSLTGGAGDDILIGQAGADTYFYGMANGAFGADKIIGWEDGADMIEFNTVTNISFFGNLMITQVGANTLITSVDITGSILVMGAVATDFTADDFVFLVELTAEAPNEKSKASDTVGDDQGGGLMTEQDAVVAFLDEVSTADAINPNTFVGVNDLHNIITDDAGYWDIG